MVSVTSARPSGGRPAVPAKMTSSILPPRSDLAPCSPMTQARASTTLDLPEPLGPTTQVMPGSNRSVVAEAKDLKPRRVRVLRYNDTPHPGAAVPTACHARVTGLRERVLPGQPTVSHGQAHGKTTVLHPRPPRTAMVPCMERNAVTGEAPTHPSGGRGRLRRRAFLVGGGLAVLGLGGAALAAGPEASGTRTARSSAVRSPSLRRLAGKAPVAAGSTGGG